jgi:hypothetical protein
LFFVVRFGDSTADLLTPTGHLDRDLRDLPEDDMVWSAVSLILNLCKRSRFRHTELDPLVADAMQRLDSSNAKLQWQWQHLERGFNSATAQWIEESTRVLSVDEVLMLRGHINHLVARLT